MRRTSLVPVLTGPLVALTLLAGCGSATTDDPSSARAQSRSSSPSGSASADQASSPLTKDDFGQRVFGAIQKAGTARIGLLTEAAGQRSSGAGQVDFRGGRPKSSVTQQLPDGTEVEAVLVDGLFFLKSPQFGPKWVKVDPQAKSGLGALIGSMGATSDPSRIVKAMSSASEVTARGTEEVDGVQTTKYHVVLPRKVFVSALGTDPRLAALLPEEIAYDMWVDAEDRVRKQVSAVQVAGKSTSTTLTYRAFGEPVSIAAPPAAQTTTSVPGLGG